MRENFDDALKAVLRHEGGFVNHPADPGGMTNLGCTRATWQSWVGRSVTEAEMRALKPADVGPLYKARYWDKVRGDELPTGVDYVAFDAAINSGPTRAIKWLQEAACVLDDGVLGPKTMTAVKTADPVHLIERYNDTRLAFLRSLSTWPTFGKGWGRRVDEVQLAALDMTDHA